MPSSEEMHEDAEQMELQEPAPSRKRLGNLTLFLLGVLILGLGVVVSAFWMMNKPKARRRPPETRAELVEVQTVHVGAHVVTVDVLGTVVPAKRVVVSPRVSGEIVELGPELIPGGHFKAGDVLVKVDATDYEIALRQRQAELAQRTAQLAQARSDVGRIDSEITSAETALAIERGQQDTARREYELLGKTIAEADEDLVLRQPQLRQAEAVLEAARANRKTAEAGIEAALTTVENARLAVERAKLDLERTTIRAPFNAVVEVRSINLGSQVSAGTQLATLVGTDEYWVEVSVPVDQLRWITIPRANAQMGSSVRVTHESAWGADAFRAGEVVCLKPVLEPEGRMARLLVAVKDPLGLDSPDLPAGQAGAPVMILGAYVRVAIEGRTLENVIRVPRSTLHDGAYVWVMSSEGVLDIRKVTTIWSGKDHVTVSSGLNEGDKLVTSDIATPIQGLLLRTAGSTEPAGVVPGDEGNNP